MEQDRTARGRSPDAAPGLVPATAQHTNPPLSGDAVGSAADGGAEGA